MNVKRVLLQVLIASAASAVWAVDLSPDVLAKFIKIAASDGKVSCKDPALKSSLEAAGVVIDSGASVVWCTNAGEIKMAKMQGKLALVGRPELMSAGGGVAILNDGGKPKIIVNKAAIAASNANISPMLFKVSEVH